MPIGVTKVWVTAVGGGSGGRYGYSTGSAAAVVNSNPVTVTPGEVITITVGAGGAARSSGGASSFGTYVVAGGGSFRMTSPYYGLGGIASGSQLVAACATNGLDGVFYPSGNTPPSGSSTMYGTGGLSYTTSDEYGSPILASIPATGYGSGASCFDAPGRPGFVQVEW